MQLQIQPPMENFSQRLTASLAKSHMTTTELARKMETHPSTITRWMNGSIPRTATMRQLARVLGENVSWLERGELDAPLRQQYDAESGRSFIAVQSQSATLQEPPGILDYFAGMDERGLESALVECANRLTEERSHILRMSILITAKTLIDELTIRNEGPIQTKRQPVKFS